MLTDFPAHCRGMMGLHPCAVHQDYKKSLHAIENQLSLFKGYVGVGEIGLDYYWDTQWKDCQKHAFATQLDWAKNLGLPVSIHSRESFDDALALLAQAQDGRLSGVFHCFGGELTQAMKIIDQGFMLGIGGVSTYKNASHSRVLPFVDMSRIVLETDSPYLSPQPKRGKVNESAFLPYVAQHLATIYKTDYDTIASITTQNAIQLFKL
jgi:TatD DNase family protein